MSSDMTIHLAELPGVAASIEAGANGSTDYIAAVSKLINNNKISARSIAQLVKAAATFTQPAHTPGRRSGAKRKFTVFGKNCHGVTDVSARLTFPCHVPRMHAMGRSSS